jgi:hypothetical protein
MLRVPVKPHTSAARRIAVLAVMAFFVSTTAFGYWTAPGAGAGAGAVLGFSTPTLTVTNPNPSTAHLAWTAANVLPVGSGPDYEVTYVVDRRPNGAGAWTSVCGTATTPLDASTLSCDNNNIATTADYDFRVTARFRSWGATVVSTAHIVADTTAPVVTLTSPAAGSLLATATPTLSGAAGTALGDQSTITVDICRGASAGCASPVVVSATASSGSWSVAPGSALLDGVHTARARQSDSVGNTGQSATRTFTIDTQDPTAAMTAPADGAYVRGSINLTATATDPLKDGYASGVASVQFERSPAGAGTWSSAGATFDTTTLLDGQYDFRAAATDQAGNVKRSAKITLGVDNTVPTGSITAPAANGYVGGTVTVTSNSADAGSGVASAQFQRSPAGANTWTNIGAADTASPYSASWSTAGLADGLYDLRVITTDTVGNAPFTSPVVTVRVDRTTPTGSITAPVASAWLRGVVNVTSNSADPTVNGISSGVAGALFQRSTTGAGLWTDIAAADTASPFAASWNTALTPDGRYDLRVLTSDVAGNAATSASVSVSVDNTAPTAAMTAPANNATLFSNTTMSATSSDPVVNTVASGVLDVQFQRSPAGAGTWANVGAADTSSPYSATLSVSGLNGQYDLRAVSTDVAGNSAPSATIRVYVNCRAPC